MVFSAIIKKRTVLYLYMAVCLLYFIALYIEINIIFTDTYYLSHYQTDDITSLIEKVHSTNWLNFVIAPIYVFTLASLTAIAIFTIFAIKNHQQTYKSCLNIGMIGQLVFAVNYLAIVILKASGIVHYDANTANDVFYCQSIVRLLPNIPSWALFACERCSIVEIIYLITTSLSIHIVCKINVIRSFLVMISIELFMVLFVSSIYICQYLATF